MNIETVLRDFLASKALTVALEIPAELPDEFVTVELIGGQTGKFTDTATVTVQAWARSRYEASVLAYTVGYALAEFTYSNPHIGRLDLEGPYHFPDPDTATHDRYQLVPTFTIV